jgi:hypothetical protein
LLVGTNAWLPEDPSERYVTKSEIIGCNRFFCSGCRSWVRHLDDVAFMPAGEPPAADLEALFADPRAERYSGFRRGWLGFRVYLCRCASAEITGLKAIGEMDTVDGWHCAGHPTRAIDEPVSPPPPDTAAQVESMLRSAASGPPRFGDLEPWDFALRWRQPYLFGVVWPVITRLLLDPDPIVRTRGLEFIHAWRIGIATTLPRLLEMAEDHADLFQEPGLLAKLASTLASQGVEIDSYRSSIAKAIRVLLRGKPPPRGAETVVAEFEPDALIASASQWTDSDEDKAAAKSAAGSMALYRRDHLLALLSALSGRDTSTRDELVEEVTPMLAVPDDKLRLILADDGISLPQTQPTVDACRLALGLIS